MVADAIDGGALRRAVIDAAADAGLRAMLASAEVRVSAVGARWESSHGAVQGYVVTVGLCAEDLGALDASPAARDLLERAFAVAVAGDAWRSMTALLTRWNRLGHAHEGAYREPARRSASITLGEALRRYGAARGHLDVPAGLTVEAHGRGVDVSSPTPLARGARAAIDAALGALLGTPIDVRWQSG